MSLVHWQSPTNLRGVRSKLLSAILALAASAISGSADVVEVTAANGTYKVRYDTALQSPVINQVVSQSTDIDIRISASFRGEQDLTGVGDGILSTTFLVHHNLEFIPNPGFAFTTLTMSTGIAGFSYGFYGGHTLDLAGLITASDNSTTALDGRILSSFVPWGQNGGGAYDRGIFLGAPLPPPGGFSLDMTETITLYDNSSLGYGSVVFDLQTIAVPEPATFTLMLAGLGLMAFVARRGKSE